MPPGRQRYRRTKMVLPLRFAPQCGDETTPNLLAHTVDISSAGAQLGGLPVQLIPGHTITLQRHHNRARFRVVWTRQLGPSEIRAGLESSLPARDFWGLQLPPDAPELCVTPRSDVRRQRRIRLATIWQSLALKRTRIAAIGASMIIMLAALAWHAPAGRTTTELPRFSALPAVPWDLVATCPRPTMPIREESDRVQVISRVAAPIALPQVAVAPEGRPIYPETPTPNLVGKVMLNVVISTTGRVKAIQILSGDPRLTLAAIQAVRSWRYNPYQLHGQAVEAETGVSITFLGEDAVSMSFPVDRCSQTFNTGCAGSTPRTVPIFHKAV